MKKITLEVMARQTVLAINPGVLDIHGVLTDLLLETIDIVVTTMEPRQGSDPLQEWIPLQKEKALVALVINNSHFHIDFEEVFRRLELKKGVWDVKWGPFSIVFFKNDDVESLTKELQDIFYSVRMEATLY